jgi:predicted nucleic acid-binding Zn ribbon protein
MKQKANSKQYFTLLDRHIVFMLVVMVMVIFHLHFPLFPYEILSASTTGIKLKMAANLIDKNSLREIKKDLRLCSEKCLARGLVHTAKW